MMRISLIGAGNVAWHLSRAFLSSGSRISYVWSRNLSSATDLAGPIQAQATNRLEDLASGQDALLICVPDQAIPEVIRQAADAGLGHMPLAHTSGASSLNLFPADWASVAVFYPLQTLRKDQGIDFRQVPVLVTARSATAEAFWTGLAGRITDLPGRIGDHERQHLHLAAVMVNNFVYHLGTRAMTWAQDHQADPRWLVPLLNETVRKVILVPDGTAQTGPAIRGDLSSMATHLALLAEDPRLAAVYRQLSRSINPELDW